MLGEAPAWETIGSAAGCGGRASWTLLGLRKGRGGREGDGRREDRKRRCKAGEADAELQPCPWLVVLTRQVFFPFSIFSPYFFCTGPCAAAVDRLTSTWCRYLDGRAQLLV